MLRFAKWHLAFQLEIFGMLCAKKVKTCGRMIYELVIKLMNHNC